MDMTDALVMGMFSFKLALSFHIFGALLLFGALGLQTFGVLTLRLAHSVAQVRFALKITRHLPKLFGLSNVLIVGSGLYLGWLDLSHGEPIGWIIVALVLFILTGIYGSKSGQKMNAVVSDALAASGPKYTTELGWAVRRPEPLREVGIGVFSVTGILVLMIFQPGVAASIVIALIAVISGAALMQGLIVCRLAVDKKGWARRPGAGDEGGS